jgi:hypothetical protein
MGVAQGCVKSVFTINGIRLADDRAKLLVQCNNIAPTCARLTNRKMKNQSWQWRAAPLRTHARPRLAAARDFGL